MPQDRHSDIVVIGAGVVGISAALALQRRGLQVRVLDRDGVASGASRGNAGAFAFTDIVPLATPGIMRKAPRWLLDPLGPLSVPPAYALKIAPWMLRFWRASWRDRYQAAIAAQVALMTHSRAALERQIKDLTAEALIRREGQLQLLSSRSELAASMPGWGLRREHGTPFDILDGAEVIAEIQPGLDRRFTHAGFTPSWMSTVDPMLWTRHLAECFVARGGRIDRETVTGLVPLDGQVRVATRSGEILADKVLIAAGAWSHHLAHSLGDRIPLETERGYNTTLPDAGIDLKTQLTFGGHGFVVIRIGDAVRVGGAVELGGLTLPPNYARGYPADQGG